VKRGLFFNTPSLFFLLCQRILISPVKDADPALEFQQTQIKEIKKSEGKRENWKEKTENWRERLSWLVATLESGDLTCLGFQFGVWVKMKNGSTKKGKKVKKNTTKTPFEERSFTFSSFRFSPSRDLHQKNGRKDDILGPSLTTHSILRNKEKERVRLGR